jgi:hypothetical protein
MNTIQYNTIHPGSWNYILCVIILRQRANDIFTIHLGMRPYYSVYDEDIILAVGKLRGSDDGVNTNLSFIITQYPDQWNLLAQKEKLTPEELYGAFMCHTDPNNTPSDQPPCDRDEREHVIIEVRLWASMRMLADSGTDYPRGGAISQSVGCSRWPPWNQQCR